MSILVSCGCNRMVLVFRADSGIGMHSVWSNCICMATWAQGSHADVAVSSHEPQAWGGLAGLKQCSAPLLNDGRGMSV